MRGNRGAGSLLGRVVKLSALIVVVFVVGAFGIAALSSGTGATKTVRSCFRVTCFHVSETTFDGAILTASVRRDALAAVGGAMRWRYTVGANVKFPPGGGETYPNPSVQWIKIWWFASADLKDSASFSMRIRAGAAGLERSFAENGSHWQATHVMPATLFDRSGRRSLSYSSIMALSSKRDYRPNTVSLVSYVTVKFKNYPMIYQIGTGV